MAPTKCVWASTLAIRSRLSQWVCGARYTDVDVGMVRNASYDSGCRGHLQLEEGGAYAKERFFAVTGQRFKEFGVRQPIPGTWRKRGNPGVRRMDVLDSESPDCGRLKVVQGVPIRWTQVVDQVS